MKPLRQIYKKSFFSRRYKLSWRAPIICDALQRCFHFDSYIDVGCAIGDIVAEMQRRSVYSCGIEGSDQCLLYLESNAVQILDLRLPIDLGRKFDLVTCFEVAEHIEPDHVDQFVDNLCRLSQLWLIVSAAPPGQGGHYHVNCQPEDYWVKLFKARGFNKHSVGTSLVKHHLEPWKSKDGIKAFYHNLILFRNEK